MAGQQRKRKTGTAGAARDGGAGEPTDQQRQPQQQQQQTASDAVSGAEEPLSPRKTGGNLGRNARNEKGQKAKNVFLKAAALDMSDDEDAQSWSGSAGPVLNTAADQERIRKEKERRKAKREQDRNRSNREGNNKQKKATKGSPLSGLLHFFSGRDFRSWLMPFLVLAGIVGIFVLKALEEYYGMDGDVSGEQRLQHLSVLGLDDGATESDIRRSYRTLSVRWHPDRYPNCGASCQQRFHEIAAAYEYLMRKQRKSKVDDEEEAGGDGKQGDEFANLKITSQGIVDFSSLGPNDVFPPTTDTKNVWSIMVHQDKDDWSQSVYEMWQESSRALGKYVKFGVISIRGRSGKDALKKLPINVKIFPAILLLTAGMHPEQYPNISRPSVESLNRFIADAFPTTLDVVESARELKSWLASSSVSQPLAAQYKAVIVPSAASASKPSLLVKHAAFSNKHLFNFCFVANTRSVLTNGKEELMAVLKDPPTWVRQLPADSAAAKALKLPMHSEDLREGDFATNSNVLLFADEGRGVSRMQSTLQTARSKLLNPSTALSLALDRFKANVEPFLYQQNSTNLCKGSLQRRVYCLVAIEPEEGKSDGQSTQKTLDLARIRQLLQVSKQKYLAENPQKNLEAVWERAVQKARDYEKTSPQKGESDAVESSISTKEPDDLHIEQPDDIEEEIIHVQLVRISIGRPIAVPSLPGLPKDTMFKRLMNEELEGAPIFLLDLEGSRVAPVPALYVGEKSKSEEDAEGLYSRLYQILDELQNSTDDEDEAKVSFSELPEYCAGQEFAKRCLASEQRPWWAYFQAGGLWLQLGLLVAVGGSMFFAWNKISAEVISADVPFSGMHANTEVGAWSSLQPILSSLFGGK